PSRSPAERTPRALPPSPRQRPVVLLHQLPVLRRHVVRARQEQPLPLVALDLAAERVLELLEPVDDLCLEALDGGEVLEVGAVQLAQAADRLVERRDVDALRGERAADLLGLGLPLLELAAELADVIGAELDGAAVAAGIPRAGPAGPAGGAALLGLLPTLLLALLLPTALLLALLPLALPALFQPAALTLLLLLGLALLLPRALAQPVVERVEPADQLARAVERLREPVLGRLAGRRGCLLDVLPDLVDVRADLLLQHPRGLAGPLLHDAAGPADLVDELGVADRVGGLLEVARRVLLVGARRGGEAVEAALEVRDAGGELFLALLEPAPLFAAAVGRAEPSGVVRE